MSGWARQSASWSGWRSSASSPLPSRLVVVSKPAAKRRMAVEVISSSLRRSSLSLACTRALKRSSHGRRRRSSSSSSKYAAEEGDGLDRRLGLLLAEHGLDPLRRGADVGLQTRTLGGRDADQLADDRHGERECELGHEVDVAALGQDVEQVVDQLVDGGPQTFHLARRERARHQPAQAGVIRRVRQQHVVLGRVEEFASAGAVIAEEASRAVLDPHAPSEPRVSQHAQAFLVAVDDVGPERRPAHPGLLTHRA